MFNYEINDKMLKTISERLNSTEKSAKAPNNAQRIRDARAQGIYIVSLSGNEKTLYAIAKKFNMSLTDFKNMTGLTKDSIQKGQEIKNIPHAKIPQGMGLNQFAKKYGMTLDQLLTLNNLPKNYKPKAGESFYIYPQKTNNSKPRQNDNSRIEQQPTPTEPNSGKRKSERKRTESVQPRLSPDKTETPAEIASGLFCALNINFNAVGKDAFNKEFLKINDKNAKEVIIEYSKLGKGESLIDAISQDVGSDKQLRKDAIMQLYDTLAKQTGKSNPKQRQEFKAQLDKVFDFWGVGSTKELNAIINTMAGITSGSSTTSSNKLTPKFSENANKKVKLGDGRVMTGEELRQSMIKGAKGDKEYQKIKNPFIHRDYPYINESGKIESTSEIHHPTNSNGPLKGKVVILNAGHGGYRPSDGMFDPGTVSVVKNAEGKLMPIEEWRVTSDYTKDLTQKLQAKGATVVVVAGPVRGDGAMAKDKYLENLLQGNRGSKEIRNLFKNTPKSDIGFMSIHVESSKDNPEKTLCTVRANSDSGDKKLAQKISSHVGRNVACLKPEVKENDYYVTRAMGSIPAVLVEIGNIANDDIRNSLLSRTDRDKYTTGLADAMEETLLNK